MRFWVGLCTLAAAGGAIAAGSSGGQKVLPAFPGAEGFGAAARGGRGGRVIKVTNLNPKGPGSLQAACEAKGPRIVVFEVSGVIKGNVAIKDSNITIAGQTAPGAGITIEGMLKNPYRIKPNLHDVVIRFLRVRPRPATKKWSSGDCLQLTGIDPLIVDHVSCSWGSDENIDVCNSRNVTVQWCAIEESDMEGHVKGMHNLGLVSGYGESGNLSVHHNLFAHHKGRNPCVVAWAPVSPCDVRNNVVYDFYTGVNHAGHGPNIKSPVNVIGNYYKRGPSPKKFISKDGVVPFHTEAQVRYYFSDNYLEGVGLFDYKAGQGLVRSDPSAKLPPWVWYPGRLAKTTKTLAAPAQVSPVKTHAAREAYGLVLAHAGCLPRDRVSRRTIDEVKRGIGKWGRNAPAAPTPEWFMQGLTTAKPAPDADGDAMPDAWERAHGLNPNDPADAGKIVPSGASKRDRHKGYTYVEFYINELADTLVANAVKQAGD